MPSFKPKANKKIKICKRYSTTLDGKHKEIMADFSKDEYDVIPRLKEEKQQLIVKLSVPAPEIVTLLPAVTDTGLKSVIVDVLATKLVPVPPF